MAPVYICGCGGHGVVVADILRACGRPAAGFIDDAPPAVGVVFGLPVQHSSEPLAPGASVLIAIGDDVVREGLTSRYDRSARAIYPSAVNAPHVAIPALNGDLAEPRFRMLHGHGSARGLRHQRRELIHAGLDACADIEAAVVDVARLRQPCPR